MTKLFIGFAVLMSLGFAAQAETVVCHGRALVVGGQGETGSVTVDVDKMTANWTATGAVVMSLVGPATLCGVNMANSSCIDYPQSMGNDVPAIQRECSAPAGGASGEGVIVYSRITNSGRIGCRVSADQLITYVIELTACIAQ